MKVARGDPGGGTASLIIAVETSACNDARFYVITTNESTLQLTFTIIEWV